MLRTVYIAGVRRKGGKIQLPELWPEIFIQRMQIGITRHDGSAERPDFQFFYQSGADRICQDVETDFGEGVPFPFFLAQDVVVSLMLKAVRMQRHAEMFAQEFHAVPMVGIAVQSHPEQMNVVGHQAIGRAE